MISEEALCIHRGEGKVFYSESAMLCCFAKFPVIFCAVTGFIKKCFVSLILAELGVIVCVQMFFAHCNSWQKPV